MHLKGRRLVGGRYEPQPVVESLDGTLLLRSETLDLDLRVKGEEMYFLAPGTGERLLNHREQDAARRAAESRADAAESRVVAAETRADAAESRANAAETRAEREHAARLAAEAELAALRARLGEKR